MTAAHRHPAHQIRPTQNLVRQERQRQSPNSCRMTKKNMMKYLLRGLIASSMQSIVTLLNPKMLCILKALRFVRYVDHTSIQAPDLLATPNMSWHFAREQRAKKHGPCLREGMAMRFLEMRLALSKR